MHNYCCHTCQSAIKVSGPPGTWGDVLPNHQRWLLLASWVPPTKGKTSDKYMQTYFFLNVLRKKTENKDILLVGDLLCAVWTIHLLIFALFFLKQKFSKKLKKKKKKMLSSIQTIMPKEVILPETIDSYRDSIRLPLPLEARSSFVSWVRIVGRGSKGISCPLTSHWPWVWLQQLRNGVWVLAAHHSTQTLLPAGGIFGLVLKWVLTADNSHTDSFGTGFLGCAWLSVLLLLP